MQGASDKEIISLANKENRIIITHDKDFYNILNTKETVHKGIILIRLKNQNPQNTTKILIEVLTKLDLKNKLEGNITIISDYNP